ncbi:hypothetical protein PACTADRAFT_184726 [Pachysolen tannophilus NRRL Y-2460]|uniref:Flo11 domain-containing protein n=1 Tax=Pachysolen tannophilus NRRL Y-2460 TaxID=669874 RepID=A0A1E4U0Y3_PACTA|nr:hypothetical protein PACTADRAFT_184726 [Pachysolen tannophilus NRRL Y-2460]
MIPSTLLRLITLLTVVVFLNGIDSASIETKRSEMVFQEVDTVSSGIELTSYLKAATSQNGQIGVNNSSQLFVEIDSDFYQKLDTSAIPYPIYINDTNVYLSKPFPIDTEAQGIFDDWLNDNPNKHKKPSKTPKKKNPKNAVRYEVKANSISNPRVAAAFPISVCLDSTEGAGGKIAKTGTVTISSGVSTDVSLRDAILGLLHVKVGYSTSLSLSFQFSCSCNAEKGETVAMYLEPWQITADTAHRKIYETEGLRAYEANWSPNFISKWIIDVPPGTTCITTNYLQCNYFDPDLESDTLSYEYPKTHIEP